MNCGEAIKDSIFKGYNLDELSQLPVSGSGSTIISVDDVIKKRFDALISQDVTSKTIQIPIVSFSLDIDYLWLVISYFGPLGMLIMFASLKHEVDGIKLAKSYASVADRQDRKYRLSLLLSTQVLTAHKSPLPSLLDTVRYLAQRYFPYAIFALPLITQLCAMYYDLFLVDFFESEGIDFLTDFAAEFRSHPIILAISTAVEITSFIVMIALFVRIVSTANDLRAQVGSLYESLETSSTSVSAALNPDAAPTN